MAAHFHHVFGCVRMRLSEVGYNNLVEHAAGVRINEVTDGGVPVFERQLQESNQIADDWDGLIPGYSNHADTPAAGRSCDSHNCVFGGHEMSCWVAVAVGGTLRKSGY